MAEKETPKIKESSKTGTRNWDDPIKKQ